MRDFARETVFEKAPDRAWLVPSRQPTERATDGGVPSITAVILTFNEEMHIERCLGNVAPLVQRIVIVDSFSTDRTVEIARSFGAEVYQRAFRNNSDQLQWALDNCGLRTDWVLRLDADEYLEESLKAEILERLLALPSDVTGVAFKLKVVFKGRWLRHGRHYSTVLARLWRCGAGQIEQRWMDEHVVLSHGRTVRFAGGDLVDENLNDIGWWTDKHNRYATRHMVDFINLEYPLFVTDNRIFATPNATAKRKRFLKNSVYRRAPLYLRALLFFLYRYVFRLGFLDGRQGFVFHFLHGFWLYVLIDSKIDEARAYIRKHGLEAFREHLACHHKIEL
jgi:glycosyltransferase involved in cell wall biosynthesis